MPGSDPVVIRPGSAARVTRRTSLMATPMAAIAAAVVLEWITHRIDRSLLDRGSRLPSWLDRGGADDVRALLSTIAGASVTVLALVLSLTMVTISLAATQFGPRLIAAFLRSPALKVTIGVFTGLFVYSLLVLDSVADNVRFRRLVPETGATVVLLLSLGSVICLVWYANTVAQSIRLPAVVQLLADDLAGAIRDVAASPLAARMVPLSDEEIVELADRFGNDGADVVADRSGYVQQIDLDPLARAAAGAGAIISCRARPGDFVMGGATIVRVHPAAAAPAVAAACERHIDLGPFRTVDQDLEFAIDQMVEIALRALSPAVNDTFTAITCVDWLGAALRLLANSPGDRPGFRDDTGRLRVLTRPRPFPGLVDAAFDKIRQAGADNPAVTIHLIETIGAVIDLVDDSSADHQLVEQAHMVVTGASHHHYVRRDAVELWNRYVDVCRRAGVEPEGTAPT